MGSVSNKDIAKASLIAEIGGGLTSMVGTYYDAANTESALRTQSDIAAINSRIAEMSAREELRKGQKQASSLKLQTGQLRSRQKTAMAANGIDLIEGSAAEIAASTELMSEIDAQTIESNAIQSAWGYKTQASNYLTEAQSKRSGAASISPVGRASASLLSSAGIVAGHWYDRIKSKEE